MLHSDFVPARRHPDRIRQGGYSLVQLLIVMTVVGILASLGIAKLSGFLRQKTLKGEVQGLVGLMRQTRSVGLKKNVPVGVIFDRARASFRIFEDPNGNGTWQAGEPVREVVMPRDLAFGPGRNPPRQGPHGGPIPGNGLVGTWASGLVFSRDPMATPSAGAAYLHHARLEGWAACLIRPTNSQQIQAYLWNGSTWTAL